MELNNDAVIGDFTTRPTVAQLAIIADYDKGLGSPGMDTFIRQPAGLFAIDLYVITTANNTGKSSAKVHAPFPLQIWGIEAGCESCAATTGTLDVQVNDVTILDAAEDVKTGAPLCKSIAPESDKSLVGYNSTMKAIQTAGSAADMIGGQAHLWCQRQ